MEDRLVGRGRRISTTEVLRGIAGSRVGGMGRVRVGVAGRGSARAVKSEEGGRREEGGGGVEADAVG